MIACRHAQHRRSGRHQLAAVGLDYNFVTGSITSDTDDLISSIDGFAVYNFGFGFTFGGHDLDGDDE